LYFELTIILYYVKDYDASVNAFKKLFLNKKLPRHIVLQVQKNFTFYEKYFDKTQPKIKELYMLKNEFEDVYFKTNNKIMIPNKVSFLKNEDAKEQTKITEGIQFDISDEIKEEVEKEIKSHDDKQIKLTVTEKIN